jgi:predicted helicase
MKLLDEVHHLTTNNMRLAHTTKKYIQMLNIPSVKQLSLTATLKQLESMCDDGIVVSNDNVEYFGEIIDRKCLLWAINENIICDYVIQTIITNEEQLEQQLSRFHIIEENDKRLFLSAFASLKSISDGHSHHLLIYSNNKNNSLKLTQYIKMLLDDNYFDIPDLYYSNYHSEMKSKDQKEIINNFEKAKFGIITCVYCLGEGWDFPLLDGVVFAENMTSNIRIVQSALRASRKNKKDTNKKSKIILPILNRDDWLENNENPDLKKVREVIYQMGLEDENISQKIKVFTIDIEKQKTKPREKEERETVDEFGEYDDELTKKLRLKTTKRTALSTTYEKAKKIIGADKSNVNSKESYYELCERNNRLPKEPEIVYKAQWKGWIDYLGIQKVYYDLETCKSKVSEYLLKDPEIKKHYLDLSIVSNELCKIDVLFPPNGLWVEYYNVKDLSDLISITNKKKKSSSDIL